MQSKKLHISERPIREWVVDSTNPAVRPITLGKPRGLWYATGLEWIDRMTKVGAWEVTGERENFPYARAIYNTINKQKILPFNVSNEPNTKRASKSHVHYVYDLTFDSSLYSEDPHNPSRDKILRLTPKCLEVLYKDLYVPYQLKYLHEKPHSGIIASLESLLSSSRFEYYKWKRTPEKVEMYGILLKHLYDTKQFTKLMMKRYQEGKEEIALDSEKYVNIILMDVLTGKIALKGILYDMFLRIWGDFWNYKIAKEWGGVDFPHELFTEEYQKEHPQFGFIKWVEIPSGVFFKPITTVPNLLFVLAVSIPETVSPKVESIKEKLMTIYSEEDSNEILAKRTYIAVPTMKGDIRFLKAPAP